ncbi:probable pseudouridine-5'-phosphatase [Drosophila nasuta]|uniref:probable pseudouridine-5'-phosphatase n=1 Tax=Drosophila nasuta TaxID=42062 RepID=UPI00295ECE28|nr:probable pseudouridine-5'-phosphatase [Drosophila nasuta]
MGNNKAPIKATSPRCLRCCPSPCCGPCVSYCIFDLESAVFDTRHIYQRACRELLATYNRTLPEAVLMQCGPMETPEMAELICRKCSLPIVWEQFLMQLNEHTCELIANPPLMEGVERLVQHLHCNCIGLALITSSKRSLFCQKIRGHEEFFELFDHVLCADEYNQPKPQPDCYLLAMELFCERPPPDCCLAFDGTTKGVQAARDARLQVIMLPDPELPCCYSELATQRLETLKDFDPEDFGMPYLAPLPEPTPEPTPRSSRVEKRVLTSQLEEEEVRDSTLDEEAPPPEEPAEEAA